jgi:hypothetical protein
MASRGLVCSEATGVVRKSIPWLCHTVHGSRAFIVPFSLHQGAPVLGLKRRGRMAKPKQPRSAYSIFMSERHAELQVHACRVRYSVLFEPSRDGKAGLQNFRRPSFWLADSEHARAAIGRKSTLGRCLRTWRT